MGTEWLVDGRAFRVNRLTDTNTFVAVDLRFQTETEFALQDVLRRYQDGQLTFASLDGGEVREKDCSTTDLRDTDDDEQELVEHRWSLIAPLTERRTPPTRSDYLSRAAELESNGVVVSARSLRRYFDAWKRSGGSRLALLPRTRNCGGRGRSRKSGLLSGRSATSRIVDDPLREVYLTTARRPLAVVVRRVLEDIQRLNSRLPSDKAIAVPKDGAIARAISRRVARMAPWEVDRCRWGRRIADQRHAPRVGQKLARRILERVEVDHTPLKVVVGTDAGPIGQPWLTVLIDYYSRMIVGFCLGFDPPSDAVLMEALRHSILPKAGTQEKYPSIRNGWPCFGIPERITCDRGADFTSKDLETAAFQLGFVLDFNPPRTPHLKGCVESFFGGLDDQLISALPGRTFRSWEKRADYNADDGPLLSYEALLEIIHVYLVDVYAQSKHPAIPKTRLEAWEESAAEYPPFPPTSPEELIVLLSRSTERTLSTRGIELGGMFCTSDALMAVRSELAAHDFGTDVMKVRYNPWNLGSIRVLNPVNGAYIRADAVDRTMEGLTEFQWKVLRRAVRDKFNTPDHQMTLAAGRNVIRDVAERTMTKRSKRRRKKAARVVGELRSAPVSDDMENAEAESLDGSSESETTTDLEAVELEVSELELDDWEIDATDV